MSLKRNSIKILILLLLLSVTSVAKADKIPGNVSFPGTDQGADQLLRQFLNPQVDAVALTKQLRPRAKDFKMVFKKGAAKKAYQRYQRPWDNNKIVIKRRADQTKLLVFRASSQELKNSQGAAQVFPAGYMKIASLLQPGLEVYRFKFVKPGEDLGYAWDGLIYVNGHWAFFPKPWRVLP